MNALQAFSPLNLYPKAALLVLGATLGSQAMTAQPQTYAEAVRNVTPTTSVALPPEEDVWNRTELYFGTEKPDGSDVTMRDFEHFVDTYVTPRFPAGLTLMRGSGQWQENDGDIIKERSFVLVLLYPQADTASNRKIQAIRLAYKMMFAQESVMRLDSLERVSF